MVRAERRADPLPAAGRLPRGEVEQSDVPNVRAIIGAHADPIDRNEAFNAAYQQIALGIQAT